MLAPANAAPQQPIKLRDAFVARIRAKHYATSTEKSYWGWIVALCRHHRARHPLQSRPPPQPAAGVGGCWAVTPGARHG